MWVLHYPTSLAYPCWQRQRRGHQRGRDLVELSQETSRWWELNLLQIASEPDGREMCALHTAEQSSFLHSSTLCSALCLVLFFCCLRVQLHFHSSARLGKSSEQMFVLNAVVL